MAREIDHGGLLDRDLAFDQVVTDARARREPDG
jgi:hypothetical protein